MGDQRGGRFRSLRISGLSLVVAVLVGTSMGVAVAVGTGTIAPPPTFAFVATGNNFPDALAVGPVAGQLGASLFLTGPDVLDVNARAGLEDVDPEIVVIAGGEAAVSKAVEDEIKTLLPSADVRRAAGANRTETAKLVSDIIGEFNPAFLPVGATAADADLLDGKDSTAFLEANDKAADSDRLDGKDSTAFLGSTAKAADADLLDGKNSTAFLGSTGKAADADLLDGLDSGEFTRTFFMEGFGPTGFAWGQELEMMRLIVPQGPSVAYDVAFRMDFENPAAVTAASGSLTCDVRSDGIGPSSVIDSTSTASDVILLEAESPRFRPFPHNGGSLGVWCINTLEDGSGDPIHLNWHGQLSSFRAEQITLEDWLGELS